MKTKTTKKGSGSGHSIRHGYAMPLDQKMDKMRQNGYTFERTPSGIIIHPPKQNP